MAGTTGFRLLGPLEVTVCGRTVVVPVGKQQVILAGLLLRANEIVRVGELVDWLWDDDRPDNARSTAQAYVRRLRQTLRATELITTEPSGYRVNVVPDELDLLRFRALVSRADDAADPAAQAELLAEALAQWRGPALADIPASSFRRREADRLTEEHLRVVEQRVSYHLSIGQHAELLPELGALASLHPFRERICGQLMVALYRSGRQVEALAGYQEIRSRLADEFGVDPGEELQRLHQAILVNDPALTQVADSSARTRRLTTGGWQAPVQLPAGLRHFFGRAEILGKIVDQLSGEHDSGVPVVAISGQPGIGKTALAVQAAHHLREHFPDGQLFVDLHGSALVRELTSEQVLARFLQALGVPSEQIPQDLSGLVDTYRTVLAGRKVLAVLDNAASAEQVRKALPGIPGSAALVTSRKMLRGLAALSGAKLVNLDVLDPVHAVALLNTITGDNPAQPAHSALTEIARLCGFLPLALRIAGANLLLRDDRSILAYVDDLRQGNRLTALEIEDDPHAAVRAVFDLSYLALKPEFARLFRLLSLVPGPDFAAEAVAALAQLSAERSDRLLAHLVTANLVQQTASDRYRLHDLLRLYSRERCEIEENVQEVAGARSRLFVYYVRQLDAVADVLYATWVRLPRSESETRLPLPVFANSAAAIAWTDDEGLNVIAAIIDAAEHGPAYAAWHLAESLRSYLATRGRYQAEAVVAYEAALHAARSAQNPQAEAAMHAVLASACFRTYDYDKTLEHVLAELDVQERSGFHEGRARALISLGNVHNATGRLNDAAEKAEEGLKIAEQYGFDGVRLYGLINLSMIEERRGRLDNAEHCASRALELVPENSNSGIEGVSRSTLGEVMIHRGRFDEAIDQFTAALTSYRGSGIRHYEVEMLRNLSDAHCRAGSHELALAYAAESLVLAEDSVVDQDQVDSLVMLASVHQAMGHLGQAASAVLKALELSRSLAYGRGEVASLLELASHCRIRGDLAAARKHALRAAELSRRADLFGFEAKSETLLAWLASEAHDLTVMRDHARRALLVQRNAGSQLGEARALHVLGLALNALGAAQEARSCWEQALGYLSGQGIPAATELQRLLAAR